MIQNNTTSGKILIIDDEKAIRYSFADFLEDKGFDVLTAENGRIGLELIEQEHPHIILVDLRMPEVDGLEVLKKSSQYAPDIPKIVISGANRINNVINALRYGAWDYLEKPVKDLSILEHTVNKALEKARLIKENRTYQENLEALVQKRTQDLEQTFKALQVNEKQLRQAQKMEAIKFLRASIPASIEIQEKIKSRSMVLADPSQTHQIIMNLCTNAYHSMLSSGGTLTVELTDIEILLPDLPLNNSNMPGNYLKLEVRDTGHGK